MRVDERAVGGSVRASGGRACLSVRRRGERGGALGVEMCVGRMRAERAGKWKGKGGGVVVGGESC